MTLVPQIKYLVIVGKNYLINYKIYQAPMGKIDIILLPVEGDLASPEMWKWTSDTGGILISQQSWP